MNLYKGSLWTALAIFVVTVANSTPIGGLAACVGIGGCVGLLIRAYQDQ